MKTCALNCPGVLQTGLLINLHDIHNKPKPRETPISAVANNLTSLQKLFFAGIEYVK